VNYLIIIISAVILGGVVVSIRADRKIIRQVREKLSRRPQLAAPEFAAAYFPVEKRAIAKRLMEITREHSIAAIDGLHPDDAFAADLRMDDLDSLAVVEFVVHLEKDFAIAIPDAKIKAIRTFGELVDEIHQRAAVTVSGMDGPRDSH
jgi:acyl carrier protein